MTYPNEYSCFAYRLGLTFTTDRPEIIFMPMQEYSLVAYVLRFTVQMIPIATLRKMCKALGVHVHSHALPEEVLDLLLSTVDFDEQLRHDIRAQFIAAVARRTKKRTNATADGDDNDDEDGLTPAPEPLPEPPKLLASLAAAELAYMRGDKVAVAKVSHRDT